MPENEPHGAEHDRLSEKKGEPRPPLVEDDDLPLSSAKGGALVAPSDDVAAQSEPMTAEGTLSRLGDSGAGRVPPGRQLSGDPPAG